MLKVSMRLARPLFLLAILVILAGVGTTYYGRLKQQVAAAPPKPKPLEPGTLATSRSFRHTQTTDGKPKLTIRAEDFREVQGKQELTGVELDIYHKDGKQYDHVKSAQAEFDMGQGILYSEGEVEITRGVPVDGPASGRLMTIHSSGVRVESKTGKASSDRPSTFQFDRGDGKAVGVDYDPNTRDLKMRSQVELIWRGSNPKTVPMKVEAGEVSYKEREMKVYLSPWSKLTRDTMALNAGPAVVTLVDGAIKLVETTNAHGTDQRPGRNLEYAANHLTLDFNDNNQITKITGVEQARLVSTAETAVTTMTSDRITLFFDTSGDDSVLQAALAEGHSVAESKPVPKAGAELADTRILKSDTIHTKMRAGGQQIESVETRSPGTIEFIPNREGQPHRWVNGEHIAIAYGEKNLIQSYRSSGVSTRTEKPKQKNAKEPPPPQLTWSKEMLATFQPNSTQLAKLEQWNEFRYQEGDRRAKADRAVLDQPNNRMDLTGGARVWDTSGSSDADKISLDQKSGDINAEGNVSSSRMPDKSKKDSSAGGGMLAEDEPMHARAQKMRATDNSRQIRYEGKAVLWQGANRLEADIVEVDRDDNLLKAHGHVVNQLLDKAEGDKDDGKSKPNSPKKPGAAPAARVFTIVRAPEFEYDDDEKIAHYKGGATLERTGMKVKAREIVAYLRSDADDSSLDHAFADGQVEIVQTAPGRVRNGTSEHAEYYVDEDKVILEKGQPQFVDSLRGTTRGEKLTWFSKDDRLLVNGVPAKSVLHRKK